MITLPAPFSTLDSQPITGRMETGVLRFGDDWPGVFIRGDHALHYALYLRGVVKQLHPEGVMQSPALTIQRKVLTDLVLTLEACEVMEKTDAP